MNDPRRPEWSDPTQQAGNGYPPNPDPAYAGQYYGVRSRRTAGPGYVPPDRLSPPNSCRRRGSRAATSPPNRPEPPPGPPKSPRWLWILAAVAVAPGGRSGDRPGDREQFVEGIHDRGAAAAGDRDQHEPVDPDDHIAESRCPPRRSRRCRPPPRRRAPRCRPPRPPVPTGTDTVVYNVDGDGRAINITYVDTGGMLQTEFNVMLPWSKEVSLSSPADGSASVGIINVGRDVTCSVSVNGVQVQSAHRPGPDDLHRRRLSSAARGRAPARAACPPGRRPAPRRVRPARRGRRRTTSTKTKNNHGARNDTARPVMV